MAKKEAQTSAQPTRRQVVRSKKEQEQQRLVYMGLGLVATLILIVLSIGLIQTYVIEPNAPVGTVNGTEISTKEYQNRVLYDRFVLDDQYQQIAAELERLGPANENDQMSQFIRSQYEQYASQVLQQRSQADRQAFDNIVTAQLVAAEAANRGLTATEEDVTEAINRLLAGRKGGYTAAAIAETSTAQAQASATAALWTPTPTLTATQEITPTATPLPTQTPVVINADELSTEYTNWINTIADQTGLTEPQYRAYFAQSVLRQKLRDALAEETPKTAEQVKLRHILVETEEEAQSVVERLNNGEDFTVLAQELSTDTGTAEQGGEIDFSPRGTFVPEFEDAAFSLPVGQISEPIETQFGWHVIEVLARENRELGPYDYAQAQRAAFDEWLTNARTSATIEDLWTPDKAPADPLFQ